MVFHGMRIFTPRCGICRLPRNLLRATEKRGISPFAIFISNSNFFVLVCNFTIYKTIKSDHCKLWFCALAPSSELDTY